MSRLEGNILNIATREFLHYGFKAVTVDQIAQKSGISKKTLYEIFPNKEVLISKALELHLKSECEIMCTFSQSAKDALDEMILVLSYHAKMIRSMNPICLSDLQRYYPQAFNLMDKFKQNEIRKSIEKNLIRGVQEGLYRQDFDIKILVQFRVESIFHVLNSYVFPSSEYDLAKASQQIFELFIYGITLPKYHKLIKKYLNKHNQ